MHGVPPPEDFSIPSHGPIEEVLYKPDRRTGAWGSAKWHCVKKCVKIDYFDP